jgi:predicted transcriptional regulator
MGLMAKFKKEKVKKSSSSIITIDPYSATSYKFSSNEIVENDLSRSSFSKNNFFVSYVMAKDIVSGTLEISRSIPENDLKDALEIKAYEDLGLDSSINYKINYVETAASASDQKNYIYDVFAVNTESMLQSFAPLKRKISYVDYITAAPFLIGALYKKGIIDQHGGAECFIYFQKNDAFLTLYQNGHYLYSKSLRYSLREINERFCSLLGERIDEDTFFSMLKKDGLNTTDIKYQQQFMKLFGEIFLYINDISVYAKRYCNISQIARVYIGTDIGIIFGMNEYAKSYMGVEALDFNFSIAINSKEQYIDQVHIMMILAAQIYMESDASEDTNFTIFKRPDPLSKRPAGKFFGVIGGVLLIALAYPAFQLSIGIYKTISLEFKRQELTKVKIEADELRGNIARLQIEYNATKEKLSNEQNILTTRKSLIAEIRSKRVDYSMKATVMSDLIGLANNNSVKIEKIAQQNDTIVLSLIGPNEKHFTELMNTIANTEKYSIKTKEIIKDDNVSRYRSDIYMEILNGRGGKSE